MCLVGGRGGGVLGSDSMLGEGMSLSASADLSGHAQGSENLQATLEVLRLAGEHAVHHVRARAQELEREGGEGEGWGAGG